LYAVGATDRHLSGLGSATVTPAAGTTRSFVMIALRSEAMCR
jgi:hypothetical protein